MLFNEDDFIEVFKKLGLKKNDKVSVGSSILKILTLNKNNKFKPKIILNALKKTVSSQGVVMIDAFSWDFCKTGNFDYYKTTNQIGSLAKIDLNDKEFIRSFNRYQF
jgi:aminoglycoside N3'-acetyltransferase